MTAACYKSGDNDKSDNNKDKVYSLFKDDVGGSRVRSHDPGCHDHGVIIAFLFGVSFHKWIIVKKLFTIR